MCQPTLSALDMHLIKNERLSQLVGFAHGVAQRADQEGLRFHDATLWWREKIVCCMQGVACKAVRTVA